MTTRAAMVAAAALSLGALSASAAPALATASPPVSPAVSWSRLAAVPASAPSVQVPTGLFWPGLPVRVKGGGFRPGTLTLTLDGLAMGTLTVRADGTFTGTPRVPLKTRQGLRPLRATQGTRSATTSLGVHLQWAQSGQYGAHRSHAYHETGLTKATIADTTPLYLGDSIYGGPGDDGFTLAQGVLSWSFGEGAVGFDAVTGKQKWVFQTGQNPLSMWGGTYDASSGTFLFLEQRGPIHAWGLDPQTGLTTHNLNVPGIEQVSPGIVLDAGRIYDVGSDVARRSHVVVALDPVKGSVVWSTPITDLGVNTSIPAVAGGRIFVAGNQLTAIDQITGKLLWVTDIGGLATRPVADGTSVFVLVDAQIRAYDAATGALRWTYTAASGDQTPFGLAVGAGRVYTNQLTVTAALDEGTGETIWSRPGAGGTPLFVNGMLISQIGDPATPTQHVYTAVDAATGDILATFPAPNGGGITGPIVADSVVYLPDKGIDAYALK